MAASEALHMHGEPPPTPADSAVAEAAAVTDTVAAATRWPQLIPIAQLLAVVLAVFAIIWNQQQATDTLRAEIGQLEAGLRAEISSAETGLRAEISQLEAGLRAEISSAETGLRAEISQLETELRAEISSAETGLRAEIGQLETELRAEISSAETGLRAEISQLRVEVDGVETELGIQIGELRAEVAENGQRLARIEGFLGIGMPDEAPVSPKWPQ